jgi:hypothetical protein
VFKTSEMLLWYLGWLPKDRLLIWNVSSQGSWGWVGFNPPGS